MVERAGAGGASGSERRRSDRFEVKKAFAEYRKKGLVFSGPWKKGNIAQVSANGVLLIARDPLAAGEKIEAKLHFAAYDSPIIVKGKTVRTGTRKPYHEIAIEFFSIKKVDAEKLSRDHYLEGLIGRRDTEFV